MRRSLFSLSSASNIDRNLLLRRTIQKMNFDRQKNADLRKLARGMFAKQFAMPATVSVRCDDEIKIHVHYETAAKGLPLIFRVGGKKFAVLITVGFRKKPYGYKTRSMCAWWLAVEGLSHFQLKFIIPVLVRI